MLPAPKDKLGYSHKEIRAICRERRIKMRAFWDAFGINTIARGTDGAARYYVCDVERAVWALNKPDGKWHEWD